MAQLKDTIVTGDLSVTGTIYGDVPLDDLSGYTGTTGFLKKENDSWSLSAVTIPDATSVKGNAETTYRTGQVNLTPANLGISATTTSVTVGSTTFNKYTHPTGDGNLHVPATSTTNNGKYLKAGSTAGSLSWASFVKPVVTWTAGTTAGPTLKVQATGGTSDAVAIPAASQTASGIVTTGAQNFAGRKGFGYMNRYGKNDSNTAVQYVGDTILYTGAATPVQVAEYWYDMGNATNVTKGQFSWREYSPNSTADTNTTGKYENYRLPNVTSGLTENKEYVILTSRDAVTIAQGGTGATTAAAALTNLGAAASNHNHDSVYLKLTGGSLSGRLTMTSGKPINQILTGSGTAGSTGTEETPVHIPAKWTFNTGLTVTNGDIFTIKIPVAGHDNGVYMSINNGTNYYPVVLNGTARHTTHFPVNTYITVIFESTGSAASIYPVNGGTTAGTVSGGVFRVLNYRDNNDNTQIRTYKAYNTNIELPLIGGSTGTTTPAAPTGETSYSGLYGQIPKTTANRATYNLSTGKITVPGGVVANITGNVSGTASKLAASKTLWGQSFDGSANVSGSMSSVGQITMNAGTNIYMHNSGTKGTNPSSTLSSILFFQDSTSGTTNTTRMGMVDCYVSSSGTVVNGLYAYDWTANETRYTNLQVVHEKGATDGYVQISGQPKTAAVLRNISYSTGVPASDYGKLGQIHVQYTTNAKPEIFPIGAIYLSASSTNPSEYFAGTWTQIAQGRTLFGAGTLGGITYTAGNTVDAGLPNVTGRVVRALSDYNYNNTDYNQWTTGPFYVDGSIYATSSSLGDGSQDGVRNVAMDLSRANSIYGNSTTVQPPALVVYMWQRTA